MRTSRRMARMKRRKSAIPKLNLTSLMDVFTVLVFFLIFNSSATVETLQTPKQITLPESVVEAKPRETVVIFVGLEEVLIQGVPVARVADIQATGKLEIEPIRPEGARVVWARISNLISCTSIPWPTTNGSTRS